jgi:hypothetical protein
VRVDFTYSVPVLLLADVKVREIISFGPFVF